MFGSKAEIDLNKDLTWLLGLIVLVAALSGAIVLAEWPLTGVEPDEPEEPELVQPANVGTELWPYTARKPTYNSRTLGINMIFFGNPEEVHTALTERSSLEWESEQVHEGDAGSETISPNRVRVDPAAGNLTEVISWQAADGATRYTYFETDRSGVWVEESYQLHAGTYLGNRRHIRAYEDPEGAWTAVQVHEEHWDWFRLRHTVTGISDSQRTLEREFLDEPYVDTVIRIPFENATADGDGWTTGIRLASVVGPFLLIGFVARSRGVRDRVWHSLGRRRSEISLGIGLFFLYTTVRWLGIAGELVLSTISPKFIAGPLYLALVIGIPSLTYVYGKTSEARWAFILGGLGIGTAIVVDFAAMSVAVVPLRVLLHRSAVVLAVGLIAIGSSKANSDGRLMPLVAGVSGWMLTLAAPLFGYL